MNKRNIIAAVFGVIVPFAFLILDPGFFTANGLFRGIRYFGIGAIMLLAGLYALSLLSRPAVAMSWAWQPAMLIGGVLLIVAGIGFALVTAVLVFGPFERVGAPGLAAPPVATQIATGIGFVLALALPITGALYVGKGARNLGSAFSPGRRAVLSMIVTAVIFGLPALIALAIKG